MNSNLHQQTCGWCSGASVLSCSNCNQLFYCCKEHQKSHWPKHKLTCKPYIEYQSQAEGRYLVASRFLRAGTLVIKESPLVLGPQGLSPLVCLGCNVPIVEKGFLRCSKCSWPMCSETCCQSSIHLQECSILALDLKRSGVPVKQGDTPRYDLILLIRCLLLQTHNSSGWGKILELEGHSQRRIEDKEPHHVAAVRFVSEVYKLDFPVETLHHVRGVIVTNCIKTTNAAGITLRGLYPTVSLLNHSCQPNLALRSSKNHVLYIRTAVDIKKGEPLLISYVPVEDPIWRRQGDLRSIYYFTCQCQRCVDPTELGTYFSFPRCTNCSANMEVPNSIDHNWTCKSCGSQRKYKDILKDDEDFTQWVNRKSLSLKHLRLFLKTVNERCHPNHYLRIEALHKVLTFLKGCKSTPESISIREDIWREFIRVHDIIEPGLTRKKGISLIELLATMLERYDRAHMNNKSNTEVDFQTLLEISQNISEILGLEPLESTEEHWKSIANKTKLKIEELIRQHGSHSLT